MKEKIFALFRFIYCLVEPEADPGFLEGGFRCVEGGSLC